MKKLLSLLASFVITGAPVGTLAACSNKDNTKDQHKNSAGNSVWAWLPGIGGGKSVTSADVWNELKDPFTNIGGDKWSNDPNEWDGTTRIKMAVQLMQILSVSILANSSKLVDSAQSEKMPNVADYQNLQVILSQQWKLLVSNTNQQVENKKQSFKNNYQKKWEDEYHKWLDKNYPDITGSSGSKKYEIEENNYKAAIMATGADNGTSATTMLTNVLLNNNMRSYQSSSNQILTNYLYDFYNFTVVQKKSADDWNKDNISARRDLAVAFQWNYQTNAWSFTYPDFDISATLKKIATDLERKSPAQYLQEHPMVDAPVFNGTTNDKLGSLMLNSNIYQAGQLSLFQKYSLERWFTNQKPLAISQVTYAFKDAANAFKDGITSDDFDKGVLANITNNLGKLAGSSPEDWETFYRNNNGTAASSKSLLTLNNSDDTFKSNVVKANIYGNVGNTTYNTIPKDANAAIKTLSRNSSDSSSHMSQVWKIGQVSDGSKLKDDSVIAFIDTDGLHIVHIDGGQYLDPTKKDDYNNYNNSWQFDSLSYAHNTFEAASHNKTDDVSVNSKMNKQFQNAKYLQYLVNQSNANTITGSRTTFNVLDEVKKYAKLDSSTDGTTSNLWWFWIFDFFNNVEKNIVKIATPDDWYKRFLTFKTQSGSEADTTWFTNVINSAASNLTGSAIGTFISKVQNENTTIQGYAVGWPDLTFDVSAILTNITTTNGKFWTIAEY